MPVSREPKPLRWCTYKPITLLVRCLHLAEAIQTGKTGKFQPRAVHSNVVQNLGVKVLWFSALKPMSSNNKYGNVSHILAMNAVMDRFAENLYFIDQTVYEGHTSTRVLLTRNSHAGTLTGVGFNDYGAPLKRNPQDGLWYHVTRCLNDQDEDHDHELELGIEVDDDDLSWMYSMAKILPNDHTLANKGVGEHGSGCHHYNVYNMTCPSALSADDTRRVLQAKCPKLVHPDKVFVEKDLGPKLNTDANDTKLTAKKKKRNNKNKIRQQ